MVARQDDDERMVAAETPAYFRFALLQAGYQVQVGIGTAYAGTFLRGGNRDNRLAGNRESLPMVHYDLPNTRSVARGGWFVPRSLDTPDGYSQYIRASDGIAYFQYVQRVVVRHRVTARVAVHAYGTEETGKMVV